MGIVFDKTSCYNATIKSSAITRGFLLFFHPRGTDAGLVSGMKLQPPASVAEVTAMYMPRARCSPVKGAGGSRPPRGDMVVRHILNMP